MQMFSLHHLILHFITKNSLINKTQKTTKPLKSQTLCDKMIDMISINVISAITVPEVISM